MGRFLKTVGNTLVDPGFGFAVCNTLLFASGGGIPLAVCAAAAGTIAGTKFAEAYGLLGSGNALTRFLKDERTPLRLAGCAMGIVAGHALYAGLMLSAFVSISFGIFDFMAAEKIKNAKAQFNAAAGNKTTGLLAKAGNLVTSSDSYVALGLSGAAVMAAPAVAVVTIPFVVAGAAVAIGNAARGKSESNGHPKIFSALACLGSGVAGLFIGGSALPAAAMAVAGLVYVRIESQITGGGFKKIVSDIVSGPGKLANKIFRRAPAQPMPQEPEPTPAMPVTESKIPDPGTLKKEFAAPVPQAKAPAPVIATATANPKLK